MIVVGTTTCGWKADGVGEMAWLTHAEQIAVTADVQFFAALEVDARGLDPFTKLTGRLDELGGTHWQFAYDDDETEINSSNRLRRICAGRNMLTDYAIERQAEWVLFVDSDVTIPGDTIPKLLDVDWPIVGGDIPRYCLTGPLIENRPCRVWLEGNAVWPRQHVQNRFGEPFGYEVRKHWVSAGLLMVHRSLFGRLRWRIDLDRGLTDDPAYAFDAGVLGWDVLARHDVVGDHVACTEVNTRPADRKIYR